MFRAIHKSQQDGSRAYLIKVFTQSFRVLAIRRVLLVLLIPLGCLVLIGASYASTTNNSNQQKGISLSKQAASDNHNENSESYFKPDQQHPVYVVNETPEKSFWIGLIDDPDNLVLSVLTGLLVICAGIQGWLLFKQDKKLELSLQNASEANKEAKQALQHAEQANKIAQEANLETQRASQRGLRAYVSFEDNRSAEEKSSVTCEVTPTDKCFEIKVNYVFFIVNRGKTPAHNVRFRIFYITTNQKDDAETNSQTNREACEFQSSILLNPGQDYKREGDFTIFMKRIGSRPEVFYLNGVDELLHDGGRLTVVGEMKYEDIYKEAHYLNVSFILPENPKEEYGSVTLELSESNSD